MIHHILSAIVFLPLFGASLVLVAPPKDRAISKYIAVITAFVTFVLSGLMAAHFDQNSTGMQFVESHGWMTSLQISYQLGVDGLSVALIALTSLLFLLCLIASWDVSVGNKGYFSLFLILETAVMGTFAAQDLFLFFAFWTATLLPIYFMISVWGNKNREYAATKFFLYQLAGCSLLLLAMFAVYYVAEPHSFSLIDLAGGKFSAARIDIGDRSLGFEHLVFVMMLVAFAIRMPIIPLHSWFAHVQTEAPSALAVIIASTFIKTGAYALIRVNYALFPGAVQWLAPVLAVIGTLNIVYGAICALGQKDIRKLVAYSCISHVGFIILGFGTLSATAFHGALLEMIAHGIYAGLLFFLIGILGSRSGYYQIVAEDGTPGFGGLVSSAPILTGFFTVAVFSALGVPGLGAFASQALVFLGVYPIHRTLTIVGLFGVFMSAGYFLWMYRRVFLGPVGERAGRITDLTVREKIFVVPLVILCVFAGVYPTPLIHLAKPTITQILSALEMKK